MSGPGATAGRRVLVTGASGFIGGHLVRRLHGLGAQVLGLDRRDSDHRVPGVRYQLVDLTNPLGVEEAVRGFAPELVFHLAARPDGAETLEHQRDCFASNTLGTLSLLDAAVRAGTGRIVIQDSTKAYGNGPVPYAVDQREEPNSSYAISKAAAWQLCLLYRQLHGLSVVGLRPTMIYGPGQAYNLFGFLQEQVDAGAERIELAGGRQTRDPLFIDDAIDALLAAAEAGSEAEGQAVSIGGGAERSVLDLARAAVAAMGAEVEIRAQEGAARPTEIWRSWSDNRDAQRLLHWAPRVPFDEGIRRTVAALRQAAAARKTA